MKNQINTERFVVMYEVIDNIYITQMLDKTKTLIEEKNIYVFVSIRK